MCQQVSARKRSLETLCSVLASIEAANDRLSTCPTPPEDVTELPSRSNPLITRPNAVTQDDNTTAENNRKEEHHER